MKDPNVLNQDDIIEIFTKGILHSQGINFIANNEILIEHFTLADQLLIGNAFEKAYSHLSGHVPNSVRFTNCVFSQTIRIETYRVIKTYQFQSCHFANEVSFAQNQYILNFTDNCIFDEDLIISRKNEADFTLSNASLKKNLILSGTFGHLTLDRINRVAKSGIVHAKRTIISQFTCSECAFEKVLLKDNSQITGKCLFKNSKIIYLELNQLRITDYFEADGLEITTGMLDNFDGWQKMRLKNSNIGEFRFALHMLTDCDINNCSFKSISLWGKNDKDAHFNLEKSTGDILKFEKVINEGLITIREVILNLNGKLALLSSNMGNTDFISSNFTRASLEFDNSKLTELFVAETDFPTNVHGLSNNDHPQAQLAFGQLHNAFERQGDMVRSLEYRAREIEAHYNSIPDWYSTKFPFINFDKLNLFLNKKSNNFGRSWIRGIAFSFVVGLFFFYSLVISSKEYSFGCGIHINPNLIASFFRFMNPLRFLETEKLFAIKGADSYLTLQWLSFVLDFLGRIAVAYGFYQTIQAFRKFGRQ